AIGAPPDERAERVHVAPEVRARREGQDDEVVPERRREAAIPEKALRQAVAVDAEVQDLAPRRGRFEDGRPRRFLRDAAPGREGGAKDEAAGGAGRRGGGRAAPGARADVVRLPPSVRRDGAL